MKNQKIFGAVLASLAIFACLGVSVSQAAPPVRVQFSIIGLGGKCLDVEGGVPQNGRQIILFDCHGGPNQAWTTSGDRAAVVGLGGKCLDAEGGHSANGTRLILFDCRAGATNQLWSFDSGGAIIGLGGKCLDAEGANRANGTRIILFDCLSGTNQRWAARPIGRNLLMGLANKCLDVEGARAENRARIILFDCHGGANQRWELVPAIGPSLTSPPPLVGRVVGLGNKCLDVQNADAANGTPIILFDCGTEVQPRGNQSWTLNANGQLVGLADKCLDVQGASQANGTPIILFDCHAGANQRWRVE